MALPVTADRASEPQAKGPGIPIAPGHSGALSRLFPASLDVTVARQHGKSGRRLHIQYVL